MDNLVMCPTCGDILLRDNLKKKIRCENCKTNGYIIYVHKHIPRLLRYPDYTPPKHGVTIMCPKCGIGNLIHNGSENKMLCNTCKMHGYIFGNKCICEPTPSSLKYPDYTPPEFPQYGMTNVFGIYQQHIAKKN